MNPVWREILLMTLFQVAALCAVVGLFLLISPQRFLAATNRYNRWVSTEAAFERLDRPRPVDRLFYRHHVITGLILIAGSIYTIYAFWFWYEPERMTAMLPVIYSVSASGWVYDSLLLFLRGAGIFGLLAGLVIALRPSLLKGMETWGNRWVATDRYAKSLDQQKELPPQWFPGRPRLFGFGILAGSLYIVILCGREMWGAG